jgi:hypothetical protein
MMVVGSGRLNPLKNPSKNSYSASSGVVCVNS